VTDLASRRGRVVAFDPGTVRIGVAVSDSARSMAFPRPAVAAGADAAARCAVVARDEEATVVVVGCPTSLDGAERAGALAAREFADQLQLVLASDGIVVVVHDERLTTTTATARLREAGVGARDARQRVDGAAAAVLLEAWLAT